MLFFICICVKFRRFLTLLLQSLEEYSIILRKENSALLNYVNSELCNYYKSGNKKLSCIVLKFILEACRFVLNIYLIKTNFF